MNKKITFFVLFFLVMLSNFSFASADDPLEIHIHNYCSDPFTDRLGQAVSLYLGVTSADGIPITGLNEGDFRILEDSVQQAVSAVVPANDEPIRFVLLMDNSQSLGGYLPDITRSAGQFLEKFGSSDESAVMKFNEKSEVIQDFTFNHNLSSQRVKEITAEQRTGTCIYDTLYNALTHLMTKEQGRRVIVLLTDGKDEKFADNSVCSIHSKDEIEKLAGAESIPVYILGFGQNIAEQDLRSLSAATGGIYLPAANLSDISECFDKIQRILKNEYKLIYESKSSGGSRNIIAEVNKDDAYSRDAKIIKLQDSPTIMFFESPAEGDVLQGKAELAVRFLLLNEKIASVKYTYKGEVIGESLSYPYSYNWDTGTIIPEQNVILEAVCFDKNGAELARDAIRVSIAEPPAGEIVFTSPADGTSLRGVIPLQIEFRGLPRDAARVEYYGNDIYLGKVVNEPFSYEWDISQLPAGGSSVTAVAYDKDNMEIARGSRSFQVEEMQEKAPASSGKSALIFVGIGIVVLAVSAVIFVPKLKKQPVQNNDENPEEAETPEAGEGSERTYYGVMSNSVDSDALAVLEVITCDDAPLIGSLYNVLQLPLSIGRSADNDLVFSSKETSVSRHHAQLEALNGIIYIRDMNSKYGTFVNNRPVSSDSAKLQTGDIIRLGKKVQLRFSRIMNGDGGSEDETQGGFKLAHATLKVDTERWKLLK